MGVIDIRTSTASLGNLGGVQMANMNTGAEYLNRGLQSLASAEERNGRAMGSVALALAEKENGRKISEALQEATETLNKQMFSLGADGKPVGFMVDAKDPSKLDGLTDTFEKSYESILNGYRGRLSRDQFDALKRHLGSRKESWFMQMANTAGATYERGIQERAVKQQKDDFDACVLFDKVDDESAARFVSNIENPYFLKANGVTSQEGADALIQSKIVELNTARLERHIDDFLQGNAATTNTDVISKLCDQEITAYADSTFLPAELESRLTDAQKQALKESQKQKLKAMKEQAVKKADLNFVKGQKDVIEADKENLADVILHQDDDDFIAPDKATKLAEIRNLPFLNKQQKAALAEEWQKFYAYREKHEADLAKYREAVEDQKKKYGYFNKEGRFIPASAFPKDSHPSAYETFRNESLEWQDPQKMLAKLEAARATGMLSEAYYKDRYAYASMRMNEKASAWWDQHMPMFKLSKLASSGYGTVAGKKVEFELPNGTKLSYKKGQTVGIWAAQAGVRRSFLTAGDMVTASLDANHEGEELVSLEDMTRLYQTVDRLTSNGVDPGDAVRELLYPSMERGVRQNLHERLGDTQYLQEFKERYWRKGNPSLNKFQRSAETAFAATRGGLAKKSGDEKKEEK